MTARFLGRAAVLVATLAAISATAAPARSEPVTDTPWTRGSAIIAATWLPMSPFSAPERTEIGAIAVSVFFRITPETIGKSQSRGWSEDPWLAPDETLEEQDYDGANEALGVDRGHQAPLAAFSGTPFWPDTNRLSNITPQSSALNQASWQRLEARETRFAQKEKVAVHVLTGPLFERLMRPMPGADERHRVPSGYWKVVATLDGRMTAFIFDQDTPRAANYCGMRRSLDEVELRARLRLFPMRTAPFTPLDQEPGCAEPAPFGGAGETPALEPVRP